MFIIKKKWVYIVELKHEKSIFKKKKKDISILQKSMEGYLACTFHARQNSIHYISPKQIAIQGGPEKTERHTSHNMWMQ